jgi:hypothetical protein
MSLVLCELTQAQEDDVDSYHDCSWATYATASWARYFVAGGMSSTARDFLSRRLRVRVLEWNASVS